MYIDIIDSKIILSFAYNPIVISIVRNFEGRTFNTITKMWSIPVVHIVNVANTLEPMGFTLSDIASKIYSDMHAKETQMQQLLDGNISEEKMQKIKQLNLPLFTFQQHGVNFLAERQSAILADEPGLGKSLQSLATLLINKSISNLIVCPASLKLQWQEEIYKWIPSAKTYVITGTKTQRLKIYKQAQKETTLFFVIINYELILRDIDVLQKF